MRLQQLFEKGDPDVARLEMKIQRLKAEMRDLMQSAGSVFQSGIRPEYRHLVDKKRREIQVASDELAHARQRPGIEAALRAAQASTAAAQSSVTPDQKRKQFGQSISKGFDDWASLRKQHGGDEGLDKAIHQAALRQTEDGTYDLSVEQLAQEFGVPVRSMYRRLEEPTLFSTSMLMPKNRR